MQQDASTFKKTKIIATIGPASEEKIEQLLKAGVNGMRLNFSHNTHKWHQEVISKARAAAKKLDRSVAVIVDLQGPKIRFGALPTGGVELKAGQKLEFCFKQVCKENCLPIQYDFSHLVKKGDSIMLRDGTITTKVVKVEDHLVEVEVQNSGKILTNHGVNLPDTVFDTKSILTAKDRADLEFVYLNDVDYVALSFVQTADDITYVRELLSKNNSQAKIIAKIETKVATQNLESIVAAADVSMIARGDLAVETSNEDVPLIGREIVHIASNLKKPVIMATQMLESMISNPQPTRAEVNDIASAVSLGVSCVMLSGETAMGQYPVETVELMKRVILKSEKYYLRNRLEVDIYSNAHHALTRMPAENVSSEPTEVRAVAESADLPAKNQADHTTQTSVSMAAITLAEQVGAKLIVAETLTGSTALSIAALKPPMPIIIASPGEKVCNQMALVRGGKPYLVPAKQHISDEIIKKLLQKRHIQKGDYIVLAFDALRSDNIGTDTVRLVRV